MPSGDHVISVSMGQEEAGGSCHALIYFLCSTMHSLKTQPYARASVIGGVFCKFSFLKLSRFCPLGAYTMNSTTE